MAKTTGVIYMLTSPDAIYIGQTYQEFSKRLKQHIRSAYIESDACPRLCEAIRKHGIEQFEIEILEICPVDELNTREIDNIKLYRSLYPGGYNMTAGGSGWATSIEARELIVNARRKYTDYKVPMYVSRYVKNDVCGFRIIKPDCEAVILCSSKLTMEQKYILAIDVYAMSSSEIIEFNKDRRLARNNLRKLSAGDDYPLRTYINYTPGIYEGFTVRYKNSPERVFNDKKHTFDEHYYNANEYLDYLIAGGVPIPNDRFVIIDGVEVKLPDYIQRTSKHNGLTIVYPNTKQKWYESKNLKRNLNKAEEYLNNCKRMQFND